MTYSRHRRSAGNPFTEYAAVLLRERYGDPRITDSDELLYDCDYAAYGRIADKVHTTFPVCEIDRICEVNAPQMYGMYLLRKEEMLTQSTGRPYGTDVRELELYHVTTESRGNESLRNGLDWRRTKRSKFGRGVSFSDDADYADFYANNTSGEERRVIIVCTVLVANTWRVNNNKTGKNNRRNPAGNQLIAPPGTSDTTVSPNGRVYVKYYDYEFYPLYLVYYRRRPEHVALSRYYSGNNQQQNRTGQQQRFGLAELERQQREQQDRERRQREEQLQRHRQLMREQQRRREQEQQEEQRRLRQRQQEEWQRREQMRAYAWEQQQQQQERSQQRHAAGRNDNNCLIL